MFGVDTVTLKNAGSDRKDSRENLLCGFIYAFRPLFYKKNSLRDFF